MQPLTASGRLRLKGSKAENPANHAACAANGLGNDESEDAGRRRVRPPKNFLVLLRGKLDQPLLCLSSIERLPSARPRVGQG